jgi:hypothetical protein
VEDDLAIVVDEDACGEHFYACVKADDVRV